MPNIDGARHGYVEDTKLASREVEEPRFSSDRERISAYRPGQPQIS